jgi:two-component system, NarL family, response regulator LiaR
MYKFIFTCHFKKTVKYMIKVMIVDDHELVREGIKSLLETYDDIKIIGEARNGVEAVEMITQKVPDILLMDIKMPKMNGIDAAKKIMEKNPEIKIIALTSFIDKNLVEDALKSGVMGYVMKNTTGDKLISVIRDAVEGKSFLSSEVSDILISDYKKGDYKLTSREKDILDLMIKGYSNKEIAKKLVISPSTVKFHVSNILLKLGVSSRNKAVSLAIEDKLVPESKVD